MRFKELAINILLFPVMPYAFPLHTKMEIRKEQGNRCAQCNSYDEQLPIHHIVPQCLGGSDEKINGVGLCNSVGHRCHQVYDQLVKEDGICFGNKFLSEMPEENFARKVNPYKDKDYLFEVTPPELQPKQEKQSNLIKKICKDFYCMTKEKDKKTRQESVV